jgi:hypothetical protein
MVSDSCVFARARGFLLFAGTAANRGEVPNQQAKVGADFVPVTDRMAKANGWELGASLATSRNVCKSLADFFHWRQSFCKKLTTRGKIF